MIKLQEGQIYKEAQITTATTASAALQLPFKIANAVQRVICEARGDICTFKFGADSSVAANKVATSGLLDDGNFSLPAGMSVMIDINGQSQNWVSVQGGAGGGLGIVKLTN